MKTGLSYLSRTLATSLVAVSSLLQIERASGLENIANQTIKQEVSVGEKAEEKKEEKPNILASAVFTGLTFKLSLPDGSYFKVSGPGLADYHPNAPSRVSLQGEFNKTLVRSGREKKFANVGIYSSRRNNFFNAVYSFNRDNDYVAYFTGGLKTGLMRNLTVELGGGARFSNIGSDDNKRKIAGSVELKYRRAFDGYDLASSLKINSTTQYSKGHCDLLDSFEFRNSFTFNTSGKVKPVMTFSYVEDYKGQMSARIGAGIKW